MKNLKKLLVLPVLLLLFSLILVSCGQDTSDKTEQSQITLALNAPTITLNADTKTVSWSAVTNAKATDGYNIKITTESDVTIVTANVSGLMYTLPSDLTMGNYQISVRANGYETNTHIYTTSVYSTDYAYRVYASPLLWLVTSPQGQTMYMFGSIHAADAALYPLPPYLMDAFNSSDYLAVEFNNSDIDSEWFDNQFRYTGGKTLIGDIGQELYDELVTFFAAFGIKPSDIDLNSYKPVYWSMALGQLSTMFSGLDYDYGLDSFFIEEALKLNMPILDIESAQSQVDMFLGFSMALQIMLLESSFDIIGDAAAVEVLYDVWKRGNEDEFDAFLFVEVDENYEFLSLLEEYHNAMSTVRNIIMFEAAKGYMEAGMQVFYVVGAAHMFGEDGLIELLRQDGFTVEIVS